MAINHCVSQKLPAGSTNDRPMRQRVGAMHNGPINWSTKPITPLSPTATWNSDATKTAPCTWNIAKYWTTGDI